MAEPGRHAVLYPAIAEAAARAGAARIGLVDVGCSAGFNLNVDRVGITYENGPFLGDPGSPVQVSAKIVKPGPVPERALPEVVTRVGVDRRPAGATPPELEAEAGLLSTSPMVLLRGDMLELLPGALARVPPDVLPVVTTTWALSRFSLERRLRFLQSLDAAATQRTVAWVSVEGVGVAPGVPTFGDRPASGHSIIGVALFTHGSLRSDAVGRAWSRGRLLGWL